MRLYERKYDSYQECPVVDFKAESRKISLFRPFIKGEKKNVKTFLARTMLFILSKGEFYIYYVREEATGRPVHTSCVTGPGCKFPFMEKGDIHIGPCYTEPDHRGKGIYRNVLRAIHADSCRKHRRAYMIVDEENLPSIKGIESAGFTLVGAVERSKLWKIYRRVSHV